MLSVLSLVGLIGVLPTPTMDLKCELIPVESRLKVNCTVIVDPRFFKSGTLTFQLGDQMSVPKIRVTRGGSTEEAEPKKLSQVDHDVTYSFPVVSGASPANVEFEYESINPRGFVYLLSPQECFAGGYNTAWFPVIGDSRRMLGTMTFTTPSGFLVKASGREMDTKVVDNQRISHFRIENPTVPTFATAPFVVQRIPGKVPVTTYFLKSRPNMEQFSKGCSDILGVLTQEFGPYPYPDFSIIETPSPESSELGFTGASFEGFMFGDSNSLDRGFSLAYFGHEMSHQWWGNLVSLRGDTGDYVFSEGLAQYGSLQAVSQLGGKAMAKQYRLNGYPLYSDRQCTMGALAFKFNGYDQALSYSPKENSVLMHELACSKGFLVWETLARSMGRTRFRKGLQEVRRHWEWSSVSWPELWSTLGTKTKMDLKLFREQWFERPGVPTVWTDWKQTGTDLAVTLHQWEPTYRLTLPLVVTFKDGTRREQEVVFDKTLVELNLAVTKSVLAVELDPDHETFHSTPALDEEMKALSTYWQVDCFDALLGKTEGDDAKLRSALAGLPIPDRFGSEFLLRFTLGGNLRREGKNDEAKAELEKALACPVRKAEFVPLAYLRLALAHRSLGNSEQTDRCLNGMLAAEANLLFPSGAIDRARQLFPEKKF